MKRMRIISLILILCEIMVLFVYSEARSAWSISHIEVQTHNYFTEGYRLGWDDGKIRSQYDPLSGWEKEYGSTRLSKISQQYAVAYFAGYGFGYEDGLVDSTENENAYLAWKKPYYNELLLRIAFVFNIYR